MNTNRYFTCPASAAALLAAPLPSGFAQALRADSSGNLREDSTLNLGGPRIIGILPSAHLGTGTPSGATVLRGDGAWVGTTPSGATVAATQNLLMGDGAGNARAVVGSTDLQRVLQLRADTARALAPSLPANLLTSANLVIRNGTLNADGTFTIPANDYLQWNSPGDPPDGVHYCYAVATTDVPVGSAAGGTGFYVTAYYNGYGNLPFGVPNGNIEVTTPAPGVSEYRFTNISNGGYGIFVVNATSAPITVYPPVMTLGSDLGLLPAQGFADNVAVASQPVADLDFTRFAGDGNDRMGRYLSEQNTYPCVDSVGGDDAHPGDLTGPFQHLAGTPAGSFVSFDSVGLFRGSLFRESLPLSTLSGAHSLTVQDVALGSLKPLPVVSALDPVVNSAFVNNGDGTFRCDWTAQDSTVANDGYQNVYVVEINTATEAAQPVASRRRMREANYGDVSALPGSVFVSNVGGSTWRARLHPSDGLAPGSGVYRYEVVSRFAPAQWGAAGNTLVGDGAMSGLQLVGGSDGYGVLSGPTGFVGDRLALVHCTTHSAVLGGGSLQRSVFYEMGDGQSIQLAWYASDPAGLSWNTDHCLFYANVGDRAPGFLLSHSGNGQNYTRGDVANCAFVAGRWSDGSLRGFAFGYHNVGAGIIERVYVQGVADLFDNFGDWAAGVEMRNSVCRQLGRAYMPGNFHDNVVALESMSDPTSLGNRAPVACVLAGGNKVVRNNLFYVRPVLHQTNDNGTTFVQQTNGVAAGTVRGNIVVFGGVGTGVYANLQTGASSALSMDYNLVIQLGGDFRVFGDGGNCNSWQDYLTNHPSLDAHSLYVDLSADPRGLRAVFADPDAEDFRWAQTDVARRCAAYCAVQLRVPERGAPAQTFGVGPAAVTSRWPVVPPVDEAVRLLTTR